MRPTFRMCADMIVANDVIDRAIGFDENEVVILGSDGSETRIPRASKLVVAHRILDAVVQRLHG